MGGKRLKPIDCGFCGKTFKPRKLTKKYCSLACSGKDHRVGGEPLNSDGYINNNVKINGKRARKGRHRCVMEAYLGYELPSHIVVHHVNCDKLDNRIENLKIMQNIRHLTLHRDYKAMCKGLPPPADQPTEGPEAMEREVCAHMAKAERMKSVTVDQPAQSEEG